MTQYLAMAPDEQQTMQQKAKQCFTKRFEIHNAGQYLIEVLNNRGIQK